MLVPGSIECTTSRFDRDRGYEYLFYQDGNGNGIRTAEIRSGVDPWISGPEQLEERFAGIRFAISVPGPVPEIPPRRGRLKNLNDPIKFGRSDILSCSRFGKCSSGTLYLSAGKFRLAAVRVRGWSTQVMRWEYDPRGKYWKRQ